jgi:DNA (cytosine-5)-methyltransferase 3A
VLINSALLSAQSRKRLYWTNITGIAQPDDRGILLKDILASGLACRGKSYCIDACYYKGGSGKCLDNQSGRRQMVYKPVALADKSQTTLASIFKENALSTVKRGKAGLICAQEIIADTAESGVGAALRTRADENGKFKRLEVRDDGKLNTITTTTTDSMVCAPVRVGHYASGGQGNRIYSVKGKSVSIMANGGGRGGKVGLYRIDLPDGDYTIRRLSPVEAERCQTLPDNYTALGADDNGKTINISNTQRYKCVGNAWTVDVIAHIFRHMFKENFLEVVI